ncbi:MAG: ectoine hydroxylase-related dioxygenase (phytanoyl-CoA dioxygenase family) [Candidatus Aldehydirespiratoraceae bacterium]|jgi:ectoine hydroxylase-related dioxygenase (phytanoyl-CoA dioxygenase family)
MTAVAGSLLDEIERLEAALRDGPNLSLERELVATRHRAFAELVPAQRETPEPFAPQPFETMPVSVADLPVVSGKDLDVNFLRASLATHGCVIVRGLIDADTVSTLRDGVDRTLDAFDARQAGEADEESAPYFTPFTPDEGRYRIGGRKFMRESGGVWAVDSPRMLFAFTELLRTTGIRDLVEAYLGERPVLSANKCNLRRVPVTTSTNWHQDGAFLGREVKSLNLWLALGACGVDAPGLDIVPRRLSHLVETGTEGAMFDWSVSPAKVAEAAGQAPVLSPEFEAGDALFFDHLFLHRTGVTPSMTKERHAIESWFFAASSYPEGQIPVVL